MHRDTLILTQLNTMNTAYSPLTDPSRFCVWAMSNDLGADRARIEKAIANPCHSQLISDLWNHPNKPLSKRCLSIFHAIGDLNAEPWSNDQSAGIYMIAKAIYIEPGIILAEARRKSGFNYLRVFLGIRMSEMAACPFDILLEIERRKFHSIM